jgi:hypothetical protein
MDFASPVTNAGALARPVEVEALCKDFKLLSYFSLSLIEYPILSNSAVAAKFPRSLPPQLISLLPT